MEMKTIIRLGIAVAVIVLSVLFVGGIVGGRHMTYQLPTQYTAEDTNNYSAVQVAMTIQDDKIIDCKITSSGESDLLNDDTRAEWAKSIIDTQSPENDVISGATLTYSAASVQKAANEILVAANLRELAADAEGLAEAEAIEAGETATGTDYKDGTYSIQQTTDFSTIDIGITVKDGQITEATITSEGANDLLTDEHRNGWEEQIVARQSVDAVSGVTVSSTAVQEALNELLAQASGGGAVAGLADGAYSVQKTTDFSTIDVGITVEGGKISGATITSEGANDLLTDEHRNGWEEQIVANQSIDAVSGVTVSSTAVQEALGELLAQASGGSDNNEQVAELKAALSESESRLAEAEARIAELEAAAAAATVAAVTTPVEEAESEATPVEEAKPEAAAGLADGAYSVQKTTPFSTIDVGFTVEGGEITGATITSEGDNDLLTDEHRNSWAEQIVAKQSVDAVSGVTVSSDAVKEGVAELLAQAAAGEAVPAEEPEAAEAEAPAEEPKAAEAEAPAEEPEVAEAEAPAEEPEAVEAEAPAEEPEAAAGLTDGTYSIQKITDFSTIDVGFTVEGGKITEATITSEGTTDLLTDDIRNAWAEQIVANQSVDAVSGVTVSSAAVEEAVTELLAQAAAGEAAPAEEPEVVEGEAPTEEPEAVEAGAPVEEPEVVEAEAPAEEPVAAEAETPAEEPEANEAEAPAEEPVAAEAKAPAEEPETVEAGLADGAYSVQKITDFSTIDVGFTVEGGKITEATITSEGTTDLLTDDIRNAWAEQIVANQSVDAVSGVTVSSAAVEEAVAELLAQAAAGEAAPAEEPEAVEAEALAEEPETAEAEAPTEEPEANEAEAPAEEPVAAEAKAPAEEPETVEAGLADGAYSVQKIIDFSTIDVGFTVEGGKITEATITSEGTTDLLTDDIRNAWAEQIVANQSVDAVSGVTVSSAAVEEAVAELLAQAAAGEAAPAEEPEVVEGEAPTEEPEAVEAGAPVEEPEVVEAEAPAEEPVAAEAETPAEEPEAAEAEAPAEEPVADEAEAPAEEPETAGAEAPAEEPEAIEAEAPEAAAGLADGAYSVQKITDFSTIDVGFTVEGGKITEATITSEGTTDLLTDDIRNAWAEQIVASQSVDAVSGVTVSSAAVEEAVAELLAQAAAGEAAPAEAPEAVETEAAEPEAEPEAAPAGKAEADAAQTASILPYIVTTMGANSENSYVVDYLEQDPYLVNIYEGYGFAKDYGSARGHNYTLEDVAKTQRPHPKANCLTCKTPDMHKMIEEQGVAVYSMPFDEVMEQMTQPIGCYTCHGDDTGNGGQLKVTHQYVNEALGENASAIQPATLSCGQCHIEYYFTPEDSETMMPYHSVGEMTPEAILAYYDAMDFADWTQESTGTRLLKAQHPEMETVLQGKHAALLTCADCHMPTETTDEGVAYRSHKLVSPLESESLLKSCATCHGEMDMTAYVQDIQDRVTAREKEVGNKLSDMKNALAEAVASGTWSEDELNAVRKLHREAQWFFDYCYVENAEGAHNSELAMSCLDTSEAKIDEALALLNAVKS